MAYTKGWIPPTFKQLQKKGTRLKLSFNQSKFSPLFEVVGPLDQYNEILSLAAIVKKPNAEELIFKAELKKKTIEDEYKGDYEVYLDTNFSFLCDQEGEYLVVFELIWAYMTESIDSSGGGCCKIQADAYFAVAPENQIKPFTIKDVIDRTLAVTPTRTAKGTNKYVFRNNANEYATEESPEFTFTGKHLFEVMLDIASYKKMFPALYKNEIYFRPFWNGLILTSDDLPPPYEIVTRSAIDQYCTALDSYVENMVCVNDTNVGTVVEPYKGGYISTRSNSGSEISETTSIVPTQSCIYQSISLNMGDVNGKSVGDIQAYVYEQEDYDALSDASSAYPYSKAYALKYTRFSKNYTELSHRIKKGDSLSDALTYPALANITKAKCGEDVGTNLKKYLSDFIGTRSATPFSELLFQPTYIPIVNARVRQYKPMMNVDDYDATLFYNQQSEVVDSEAFGEHVKGLVQKLGNHTEIRVYRFACIDDVPTVGTIIDGKSVYDVAVMIYENHVDTTICLVDYAELSNYIGVKNEIKTSDISTTKWYNRFVNWEEFLIFTHENIVGNTQSITKDALTDIVSFTTSDTTSEPLSCAMFTSYTEDGASIITAFASIKHLVIGNSIYFQWEMLDNFSVGYKSEKAPEGATNAWTGTKYNRAQKAVRYCDAYGRAETVDFRLLKWGPTPDNSSWRIPENDITWNVDEEEKTITFSLRNKYPCYIIIYFNGPIVEGSGSADFNLVIKPENTTVSMDWAYAAGEMNFVAAYLYVGSDYSDSAALAESYIRQQIAHEYPQKPDNLMFAPSSWDRDEKKHPSFQLYDWLIKKNSAESLKFAAQYHFRQTWREFIIGSGMSNFCSLIGGFCKQLQLFVSAFPINQFERHVNLDDTNNYLILSDLPVFNVDEKNMRVEITLPDSINDYPADTKSWGLVGIDRNDNRQLIFGENKNAQDEAFLTTIYLVAMQKNNEPKARSSWRLQYVEAINDAGNNFVLVEDEYYDLDEQDGVDVVRGARVTIKNNHFSAVYLTLNTVNFLNDGTYEVIKSEQHYIKYRGSYSFIMKADMTYSVWTTGSSSGGGSIVV